MAKKSPVLAQLSTAELKRLLVARERIDVLEAEKARLVKQLATVDRELDKLLAGAPVTGRKPAAKGAAKTTGRKKTRKAAVTRKTAAAKGVKAGAKKTTRKRTTQKKTAKKTVRRTAGKVAAGGRVRLEDVIVAVIGKHKGAMPFKDLHAAIVKGKLYKSKSSNFDNVLRRTLSTSKKVKRVGRGIYDVA